MLLLSLGVLLWAAVHFLPALAQPTRQSLISRLGENGYKGLFSTLLIVSLLLMVFGWRSIEQPAYLYTLPIWSRHLGMLLVLIAFILFAASGMPTRIKRLLRHPQLTGVAVWGAAHLLMNGDSRSVVLFGGMGIWALVEIVLINRREGTWSRPDSPAIWQELKLLVIGVVAYLAVMFAHPWIAGVAVF